MCDGRVSIDASEVIDQPGYLQARREAAALVRRAPFPPALSHTWQTLNDLGINRLSMQVAADSEKGWPDT